MAAQSAAATPSESALLTPLTSLTVAPLTLDLAAAYAQDQSSGAEGTKPDGKPVMVDPSPARWGISDDHWWIGLGGGAAFDFDRDYDFNIYVSAGTFVATDLEFTLELGAWYFEQEGPNTGGIHPNINFRWHFWHDDDRDWTVYADTGVGLLFSFDDTPAGGTSFNFTPRVGVGATFRLDEDETRLQVGLRYHHISNARIEGDGNNPARDSVMVYAGVIFPF